MTTAENIVNKLMQNLQRRDGFGLTDVEEDILADWRSKWIAIVEAEINPKYEEPEDDH